MGVIPLDIHSVAYNLVPALYMIPLGLSIALSIRMGSAMSESIAKAKVLAAISMGTSVLFGILLAIGFYFSRDLIVRQFTTNTEVFAGCKEIWPDVCVVIVLRFIYVMNTGILRGLGMQWRMAGIVLLVLWISCIPTLIHVGIYNGGGVTAIWRVLPWFYVALNILLSLCYMVANWQEINDAIKAKKDKSQGLVATEESSLL